MKQIYSEANHPSSEVKHFLIEAVFMKQRHASSKFLTRSTVVDKRKIKETMYFTRQPPTLMKVLGLECLAFVTRPTAASSNVVHHARIFSFLSFSSLTSTCFALENGSVDEEYERTPFSTRFVFLSELLIVQISWNKSFSPL